MQQHLRFSGRRMKGMGRCGRFSGVILTGAFLADAAAAVDNKLNVSGGVLSRFALGPDRLARFVLVVLTQSEPGSSDRQVEIEMRPPTDDDPIRLQFEVPESAVAEFPGFAFFELQLRLPVNGRWVLVVTGGTGAISLPVLVSEMPSQPSFGL
ncbi:hypothetical protein LRC484719_50790 [Mycobacterium riyadhense]|uniref:Uncharacterized protein n=1 Tax=Mycobacterium riyadhense TaxID=486698 RepID=A0A653ERF5_9MYCO|nr:hypothetical protein BIN_B_03260 [Mycobacterium riyadhense]